MVSRQILFTKKTLRKLKTKLELQLELQLLQLNLELLPELHLELHLELRLLQLNHQLEMVLDLQLQVALFLTEAALSAGMAKMAVAVAILIGSQRSEGQIQLTLIRGCSCGLSCSCDYSTWSTDHVLDSVRATQPKIQHSLQHNMLYAHTASCSYS